VLYYVVVPRLHRAVEQILGYKLPGFHGGLYSDYGFRVVVPRLHRAVEQILGYKLPGFHGGLYSDYGFRVLTLCNHVVTF